MRKALVLLVMGALLSGCGFHLRGAATLPPDARAIFIRSSSAALADEIELYLRDGGARLSRRAGDAQAILDVGQESFEQRTLSVDPKTGKEREFELTYSVEFGFKRADGTVLVKRQLVTLHRDFVFDPGQVIGKSREKSVLEAEMRRDAAQRILARLNAGLAP